MGGKLDHVFKIKWLIILLAAWVLLWLLPWTTWLDTLPWLRSGLSLLLFIVPGMSLSLLLTRDRFSMLGHFVLGFALSIFWVGVLGFTSRILHWPFQYIKVLFALSGFFGLFALIGHTASGHALYKPAKLSGRTLVLLLFMIVFAIIANHPNELSTDDYRFIAYLTNW